MSLSDPPRTTHRPRLDPAEVEHFHEHGYVLFHRPVFPPAELGELYELMQEQLDAKGEKLSDELDTPHFREPRLLDYLLSDGVLDIVEPILGPDIFLWSSHFIIKNPLVGRDTPWHEDSAYWQGRLDDYSKIATVWLAMDPVWSGNGCMRVVDGSHRQGGFSAYRPLEDRSKHSFGSEISAEIDENKVVNFELSPGEASLHDGRIMHGATANTSKVRRAGYTMRYMAATTKVIPEANPGFRIWLARGQDRAGNDYENV